MDHLVGITQYRNISKSNDLSRSLNCWYVSLCEWFWDGLPLLVDVVVGFVEEEVDFVVHLTLLGLMSFGQMPIFSMDLLILFHQHRVILGGVRSLPYEGNSLF